MSKVKLGFSVTDIYKVILSNLVDIPIFAKHKFFFSLGRGSQAKML